MPFIDSCDNFVSAFVVRSSHFVCWIKCEARQIRSKIYNELAKNRRVGLFSVASKYLIISLFLEELKQN